MSNPLGFHIGTLCVLLAVLVVPPHAPATDVTLAGICVAYLLLIVWRHRGTDA